MKMFVYFILCTSTLTVSGSINHVFQRQIANDDSVVDHPVLETFENCTLSDCVKNCIGSSFCLSIYYNKFTQSCITNAFRLKDGSKPLDASSKPGFRLYRLQNKKEISYPSSCSEVKANLVNSSDGEYWLDPKSPTLDGNRVRIYCHGMDSDDPTEYVTLPNDNFGNYPRLQNRWCSGESNSAGAWGETHFTKIKVQIDTMTVDRTDYTFSTWTGTRHPYGEATDCYNNYYGTAPCGPVGTFKMDTRGTGLVFDPEMEWIGYDWRPYIQMSRSEGDTVIDLLCGGWCGGCVPQAALQLYYNHNERLDHDQAVPSTFSIR